MDSRKLDMLKDDLKTLLNTYNVDIAFLCSDSSDTHGLYKARVSIIDRETDEEVISSSGFHLDTNDL